MAPVCLLLTRNQEFARLIAQIIQLRVRFLEFEIKTIRIDNAIKFTSQDFNDYRINGVIVEHVSNELRDVC